MSLGTHMHASTTIYTQLCSCPKHPVSISSLSGTVTLCIHIFKGIALLVAFGNCPYFIARDIMWLLNSFTSI